MLPQNPGKQCHAIYSVVKVSNVYYENRPIMELVFEKLLLYGSVLFFNSATW